MDITIKTTFKIGDKVYIPECYNIWFANSDYYIIEGINILITTDTSIEYIVKDKQRVVSKVKECFVFGSYDECKQWCDEGNKEI